ncbi:acyl-CoA mutase large subunit family protein [Salsipaludibacter albus]|uniref:acyl-CoA mutase large subunit family protein n=1 Tax=Salsipaludibacter albus TaxID=2849650 RepID=UPI001EE3A50B|nr:methylmalonyl-CoA mutase family protein [Salsipaludibacter albus]MBY5161855.1 methylmalonyl-CoA mutase [Salsipaludibacter albus]
MSSQDEARTVSGFPIETVYGPEDLDGFDPVTDLGAPGEFPYTRGPYPTMYRGRHWTMRQYAGFSTAAESNARYKYLLAQGTTGLSVAFDLPTQMGYDSSAEIAEGEVGKVGVAIDTVEDMKTLFDDIPLDEVSTSMTINAPAALLLLMYEIAGEEQGVDASALRGTIQNDVLKEYIARGTYIYPPKPSLRLVADTFGYCAERLPRFNTISISGYHIGEAGATPVQELAFTIADGIAYVEAALAAGLDVDAFAPRLSFFFVSRTTLLEEVAKFRAARRIWARLMRDRFGATDDKSMMLRFHTQTAGVQLTAQQPEVNLVRVAIQALAATLGGTQSLHTNSYDEALALPTEESARLALRTQQVIAHETDVASSVDPLAGSYLVEAMTDRIEAEVDDYLERIDRYGGAVAAIEEGFQKGEIERSAYAIAKAIEDGEQVVVGVNRFTSDEDPQPDLQRVDEAIRDEQVARIDQVKSDRDADRVADALDAVRDAARGDDNLLPPMRDALQYRATLQEVCDVLRGEWGDYVPRDTM